MDGTDLHCCFVIQAVVPYYYDLNQILALPTGFRYRNRYQRRWVEPNLRDDASRALGRRVLIIMRDRERARLVPARWARIVVAQTIGDILYFEYLLEDLIAYSREPEQRETDIEKYTAVLGQSHRELPGSPGEDLVRPSVFLSGAGAEFPTARAEDLASWGTAVAAVATADIYEKVNFLKIVGLAAADDEGAHLRGERYELAANTVYTLRVFQTMPNFGDGRVAPHDLVLRTFPEHIALLRPRQRAVGKYDMLTFVLKVLDLPSGDRTSIEIDHETPGPPGLEAASSIYLPVVVRPRDRLRAVLRLGAGAAALVFMFDPDLVLADPQVIRNLATVLFVLAVAGASRTLQAFWPNLPWR